MRMRTFLAGLALTLLAHSAAAQADPFSADGPVTLGTTYSLQSEALGEPRRVFVSLPAGYESSTRRYPVVYLLDAQAFPLVQYAYGEVNALAALGEMPRVILVGVPSDNRNLDMTAASPTNEGRADAFIEFFRNELQVFIDAQFRTEPYTIMIGHSLGGTFAIHALARQPDTFDAYIALSPALWVDGQSSFREFKERLASGAGFDNALFVSVADEYGDFPKQVQELVAVIEETKPPGLELAHMTFAGESHESTPLPGIHHGLLSLYTRWVPPMSANDLASLQSHYEALSEHYGYSVVIPTAVASRVGRNLLLNKNYAKALEVFEYTVANLAQGPNEYHLLGRALRALGRAEESLVAFENAVAAGSGSRDYDMFVRDRDQVAQELNE